MRKPKTPTPITTAMLTLITILFWAGFAVYRALTVKPAPPVPPNILRPLSPSLDTKSLDQLSSRLYFTDDQIGNIQSGTGITSSSSSPTPVASTIPVSTVSAIPQSTSSAGVNP